MFKLPVFIMKASVVSFFFSKLVNYKMNAPCISCRTEMSNGANENKKLKVSGTVVLVYMLF